MSWKVSFYDEKLASQLARWPVGIAAKFARIVELIEQQGPMDVGMPLVRSMREGLYEIRAKGREGIGRALFCTVVGKEVIILHGFIKKTQKTPTKELNIARKRLCEVKEND